MAQDLLRTPAPFTRAHAQAWVGAASAGLWAGHTHTLVIALADETPVGPITLCIPAADPAIPAAERAEDVGLGILGYSILPAFWGRGYASASAALLVAFGFDTLGLAHLQGPALQANTAARRLLERLGFRIVDADILEEPLHDGPPQLGDCAWLRRMEWQPHVPRALPAEPRTEN